MDDDVGAKHKLNRNSVTASAIFFIESFRVFELFRSVCSSLNEKE